MSTKLDQLKQTSIEHSRAIDGESKNNLQDQDFQ